MQTQNLKQNLKQNSISVFKSNEPIYNENYFRYPLNSLTSLTYCLPIYQILCKEKYLYTDIYGLFLLTLLTCASFLWWALSYRWIQVWDLYAVIATKTWILSNILEYPLLNLFPLYFLYYQNNYITKYTAIILTLMILYFGKSSYGNNIFMLSILGKLSDTYGKNEYGTAVFHVLSAISIFQYFSY